MTQRRVGRRAKECPAINPASRRHAAASRGRTGRRSAGGTATTKAGREAPPTSTPSGPFDPDAKLIHHCQAFILAWNTYNTRGGLLDCAVCPLWKAVEVERAAVVALRATTLAGVLAKCRVARSLATQPDGLDYDSGFTAEVPGQIIEDLLRIAPFVGGAGSAGTGGGSGDTLIAMLAATRSAEAAHAAACGAEGYAAADTAEEDLSAAIAAMAATPADSLRGVAAKAARLCDSLAGDGVDGEPGHSIMPIEEALVASLAADIARLLPETRRPDARPLPPAA